MRILSTILLLVFLLMTCSEPEEKGLWSMLRDQDEGVTYRAIQFTDENNGWIVGDNGTVQHSGDGGETWQKQNLSVSSNLWDITFVSNNLGWVCGANGTLLKTQDGGGTWNEILVGDTLDGIYVSIAFIDENIGWLSNNNGSILRTTDGGVSWVMKKKFSSAGSMISAIDEYSACILHGKLYRTLDGGENWDSVATSIPRNYIHTDMFFSDKNNGVITMTKIGGDHVESSPVEMTHDAGNTWQLSEYFNELGFNCVYFIDDQIGWIAGYNAIYKTSDGGSNWTEDDTHDIDFVGARDMYFINDNHGWIVGWNGQVLTYKNK